MTTETQEARIETYVPLYRKYRPQLFADLVGQEAISQTLGNAINLNKVAHAYLFCGPRGTGKTSTARIFAKSLNCEQGPTVTPCLQCASCSGITQGNALDVIEFDAASNNGVGDARELIENCQYSSMTGRFKVYIIDEVHMLTPQAFNALLKTLEEPPANVIFIFATTEAHKVLPTIISRCQRFDFNRITTDNIVNRLRYIAEQEAISIDEEALLMIGRHARGGLRDAVGLLDQVSVLSRAQVGKVVGRKDVALFIGNLEEDLLLRLSGAIAERRAADLLNELSELLNRGIEPIQLLKDLTVHFRNLLLVQAAGAQANPDLLSLPPDYFQQLTAQAKRFPEPEEVPQMIGRLAAVERNVRNSSQPQLWLEVGLIELAYRHEIQLVKDLSDRVEKLEAQLAGGAPVIRAAQAPQPTVPAPRPQTAASPRTEPVNTPPVAHPSVQAPAPIPVSASASQPTRPSPISEIVLAMPQTPVAPPAPVGVPANGSLEAIYTQACNTIPSLMFRALIQQQTFPISLEGDLLVVGCVGDPNYTTLKKPDKFTHLQKAVDKAFGRPIRIEVTLEKKKPAGGAATATSAMTPASQSPAPQSSVQAPQPAPVLAAEPQFEAPTPAAKPFETEKPAVPFAPAMQKTETIPFKPLDFSKPPAQGAAPAIPDLDDDEPPPLTDDDPGMDNMNDDDGFPPMMFGAPAAESVETPALSSAGEHDLSEAKKHAVELLQGRILD